MTRPPTPAQIAVLRAAAVHRQAAQITARNRARLAAEAAHAPRTTLADVVGARTLAERDQATALAANRRRQEA